MAHQIIGTEVVIFAPILGTFPLRGSITMMHEAWAHSAFMWAMHLVLSDTPLFPVQIAAGAYLGWRPHSAYFGWGCRADDRCYDQLFFTHSQFQTI